MDRALAPPLCRFLPPRYRVDRVLSHGERNTTLEVFDTSLRQAKAVVKVHQLAEEKGASEAEGEFRLFCAKLASIRHELIAVPYTFGAFSSDTGSIYGYTARTFVSGVPLASVALPMPEEDALTAIVQVCNALNAAHAQGLYHCDLKPENIIVRRAPGGRIDELSQCILIDFSYRPAIAVGTLNEVTLQYLAPEMLTGSPPDQQTDLYALGVMLYKLLRGKCPFEGASLPDVMRKQRSAEYTPLRTSRPGLFKAVHRLLEPNPSNRPDGVEDLLALIDDSWPERRPTASKHSGFVGRQVELDKCVSALAPERPSAGASGIVVSGGRGCGVTAFLRELQDQLEARGLIVLTAAPRGAGRTSLQMGLREQVHTLARRSDPAPRRTHLGAPGTATDLLDDMFVAAQERRVVLFVDDLSLCDVSEAAFLRRAVLQDNATIDGNNWRGGRCQVVMGDSRPTSMAAHHNIGASNNVQCIELMGLSEQETEQWIVADGRLPRRYAPKVHAVTAGYPRLVRLIIEQATHNNAEPSDTAFNEAVQWATSVTANPEDEREIGTLRAHDHGRAVLALALWGDVLQVEHWDALIKRLSSGASGEWPVDLVQRGGRTFACSRHRHLGELLARNLAQWTLTDIGDALVAETWEQWRSYDPDDLVPLLRLVARLGRIPPRARWRVCRALIVLLERGRFADIESVTTTLSTFSDAPWWVHLFRDAGRAGSGSLQEPSLQTAMPGIAEPAVFFRLWIRARVLMRARYRQEALQVLERLSLATLPCVSMVAVALAEDHALAAAELRALGDVVRLRRTIAKRIAPFLKIVRRRHRKRDAVEWRARLRSYRKVARYQRVRSRTHLLNGHVRRALAACQAERRLNRADGNTLREAACLNNEGILLMQRAAGAASVIVLERCARLREALDDEHGLVVALNNLAAALSASGQLDRAVGVLNRARLVAARNGLSRQRNMALVNLAIAYARRGQVRDAQRVCRQARRHCAKEDDADGHARALFNGGCAAVDLMQPATAEAWAARLGRVRQLNPACGRELSDDVVRAELSYRCRDWAHLHTVTARLRTQGLSESQTAAYVDRLALESGDGIARRPLATEHALSPQVRLRLLLQRRRRRRLPFNSVTRAIAVARRHGCPREAGEWLVAHMERKEGDTDDAVALGLNALSWFEFREGHDDLQIEVRARLGEMLRERGRHSEAWRVIEDALFRFRQLERKLRRWPRRACLLAHLQEQLQRALKRTTRTRSIAREMSAALCAQAFEVLTEHRRRGIGAHDWHVPALLRLGAAISRRADHGVFLDEVMSIALSVTGAQRSVLVKRTAATSHEIVRTAFAGGRAEDKTVGDISWAVVSQVMSTGEASVFSDALTAEELSSHRSIAVLKLRSLACVPLRAGGQVVGALYLDHHSIAGLISEDMMGFLDLLAGLIGTTLHMERVEEQTVMARRELVETHRHLMRAERNRLAGELAGGLVHDLKNVLAAVSGRAQLLRRASRDDQVLRSAHLIEKAAGMGVGLVQRLQECTRDHSSQSEEPVDLTAVAHEAVELLGPRLEKNRVTTDIQGAADTVVWGVAGEYREMFLNLFVNACDSMPDGGRLSVGLSVNVQAGEVVVTVGDTGVGMSPETQARLFEPFYTTKGSSGTGLGLVVVKSVVVRHGGSIAVQSTQGVGTQFRVALPCTRRR